MLSFIHFIFFHFFKKRQWFQYTSNLKSKMADVIIVFFMTSMLLVHSWSMIITSHRLFANSRKYLFTFITICKKVLYILEKLVNDFKEEENFNRTLNSFTLLKQFKGISGSKLCRKFINYLPLPKNWLSPFKLKYWVKGEE